MKEHDTLIVETQELTEINKKLEGTLRENRETEGRLRRSEERYRVLFDHATVGIFIAQDGVIKFPNPAAQRILGYSEEELSQIPFAERIHVDDREMVLNQYRRRLEGDAVPAEYSFRYHTGIGHTCWIDIHSVMVRWGGRAGFTLLRDRYHRAPRSSAGTHGK